MKKLKKRFAEREKILVSACLVGMHCRWDKTGDKNNRLYKLYKQGKVIAVCPEEIGGLGTPRKPAEILGGSGDDVLRGQARVFSNEGCDVTDEFIRGARRVLEIVRSFKIKKAVLKSKSPSCGLGCIYDGTFSGDLIPGHGVTAALLLRHKIKVADEKRY